MPTLVAPFRLADKVITERSLPALVTVEDWRAQPGAGSRLIVGHHSEIQPLLAEIWWVAETLTRWIPVGQTQPE